ncbi:MAG: SGNH/GDSL hydrolase family protein [Clostridium sp.]|uniref:SGNH/GDSL hydrolase family protein n=1 Tax=Clostridium sp. TaxID=1506 RepID=UPI003F2AB56B
MNSNKRCVVLLGDSLTFGYGVSKKDSFAYKIGESLNNVTILNKGINGDTTSSMLSRYFNDVIKNSPSTIFIMGGTNDLLSGRNVDYIIKNIELLIKEGLECKANIVVGIPPIILRSMAENLFMESNYYKNCEESLPILRNELINLNKKYPFKYVDLYELTKNHINERIFLDGIHLNALGNDLIFKAIVDVL